MEKSGIWRWEPVVDNTSIADSVWLPIGFEEERPVIRWLDKWRLKYFEQIGAGVVQFNCISLIIALIFLVDVKKDQENLIDKVKNTHYNVFKFLTIRNAVTGRST